MRTVLRLAALIVGVIGAFDGLVVNIVVSASRDVSRLLGGSADPSHGIIGGLLCLVALIGAIAALRVPVVGGILLLVAGIGFFFIVHWWGLLAAPQMLVAGVLALADRGTSGATREMQRRPRSEPMPTA